MLEHLLNEPSRMLKVIGAFAAGLLTLLTPCVYPLIPITLSVCGARNAANRREAFLSSFAYCVGICVSYTAIGFVAIQSGALFGSFLAMPAVRIVLCLLLVALALYSLEVVNFSSLTKLQTWASQFSARGYSGALLMGMLSGFVAAPCVGPVLVTILSVAASVDNKAFGVFLLFSYAVGMSIPFLVLGTFASLLPQLPKSGNWLHGVKFITAVALLLVVGFLNQELFNPLIALYPMPLSLVGLIVFGLFLAKLSYQIEISWIRIVAAAMIFAALHPILFGRTLEQSTIGQESGLAWLPTIDGALKNNPQKLPIMIDFFATWCAACVEFDAKTFPDGEVKGALSHFTLVRLNFSSLTEENNAIAGKYNIAGLPSILFLYPDGSEIPDTRVTGFKEPVDFVQHLKKVIEATTRNNNPTTKSSTAP